MTPEEAKRLLALSRQARWTFPSSFGSPALAGEPSVAKLVPEQESVAEAATVLVEEGDGAAATELAANAWRLWLISGDVGGGRRFLGSVLDVGNDGPSRERSLALYGAGLLALRAGDRLESERRNEEALEIAQACGDSEALALSHLGLSRVALENRDQEAALAHAVRAREHAKGLEPALGQAPLHLHAQAVRLGGDYDGAAVLFEASLELNGHIGDRGMVEVELYNLGHVEVHRENAEAAARYFDALTPDGDGDDPSRVLADAALAYVQGDRGTAESLLARIDEDRLPSDDRSEAEWLRSRLAEPRP